MIVSKDYYEVFSLRKKLEQAPELVASAQALSLNAEKPLMGLKGNKGLYGSKKWWRSISSGKIKNLKKTGSIIRTLTAGMENCKNPNAVEIRCNNGDTFIESIYVLLESDRKLYVPGNEIIFLYALDELKKRSPNGDPRYIDHVIQVLIKS